MKNQPLLEIFLNETRLTVTPYALCVAAALVLGVILLAWRCKKAGLRADTAGTAALLGIPLGLLGARLLYVICRLFYFLYMLEDEGGLMLGLHLWQGGYALWGAVAGAALAGTLTGVFTKQRISKVLDAMAAPAALIIALCRFAEYFVGLGLGLSVETEAFQRFPLAVEVYEGDWYWAVFMLEGAAALAILCVLLATKKEKGGQARLMLLLYSACQIVLESMRSKGEVLTLPNNDFVRASQVISLLVLIGLMTGGTIRWGTRHGRQRISLAALIGCWAALVILAGVVVAMEFSMDNKISFLRSLSKEGAHLIMAFCAAGMGIAAYWATFSTRTEGLE